MAHGAENKKIAKSAGFIAVFLVIFLIACFVLERKDSYQKYREFFDEEEDFDVLWLGTSHMLNGVFPMELWHDYGISSYNMGGHGNAIPATYWVLRNALDYTTPKVVVIDTWAANVNVKGSVNNMPEQIHNSFDAFPLSWTKVQAINDISEDGFYKWDFLFEFSVYHNRWEELGAEDFAPSDNVEKGAESRISVMPLQTADTIPKEADEAETVAKEYLRKMIELCQERDIQVVLVYLPFSADEAETKSSNSINAIAQEYGVPYINFLYEDTVDYRVDMYDSFHLNPSGARKVTDYIGEYLVENCGLTDHRQDEAYAHWSADYERYEEFKIVNLNQAESVYDYLMLLQDKNLSCDISVRKNSAYLEDAEFLALLQNIGITDVSAVVREDQGAELMISVYDRKTGEKVSER